MNKQKIFTGTIVQIAEYLEENYDNFSHLNNGALWSGSGTNRAYWNCYGKKQTSWIGLKAVPQDGPVKRIDRLFSLDLAKADEKEAEAESDAEKGRLAQQNWVEKLAAEKAERATISWIPVAFNDASAESPVYAQALPRVNKVNDSFVYDIEVTINIRSGNKHQVLERTNALKDFIANLD